MINPPSRFTSQPLPSYSYVPRMHPHPVSDHAGHSYGERTDAIEPSDDHQIWQTHLWAVDLFNAGYYWEAHEAWESLWIAFFRTGPSADFVKGLIKLAAAGVKAREGNATGVKRHAIRAVELFQIVLSDPSFSSEYRFGLSSINLMVNSKQLSDSPNTYVDSTIQSVKRVMPFILTPSLIEPASTSQSN